MPDIVWRTNANQFGSFSVVFAPDSKSVFSYGGDAKQWRVSDRSLLRTFVIPNQEVAAIALSPDGARLVGWSANRGFRMWRVTDGAELYSSFASGASLAFSPMGNFIARGTFDGTVVLLPVNGEVIGGGTGSYDEIHSDSVNELAFSPDGSLLLTGSSDSTAKLLRVDPSSRGVAQEFEHRLYVKSVSWCEQNRRTCVVSKTGIFQPVL